MLAPIILFTYCRPNLLEKTIEALKNNFLASDTDLIVYSDGPKDISLKERVEKVRVIIDSIEGFKSVKVIKRPQNFGLAKSIITGVTEVLKSFEKCIVLEEDLITSKNFIQFANQSLNKYQLNSSVFSIASYTYQIDVPPGYEYDNYFTPRCESLGWGTWKDRWQKADWEIANYSTIKKDKNFVKQFGFIGEDLVDMLDKQMSGKLDSWAVRWCYNHFINNAFCSYPTISKIEHIGTDEFGTNVKKGKNLLITPLDASEKTSFNLMEIPYIEEKINKQYQKLFKRSLLKKMKRFAKLKN